MGFIEKFRKRGEKLETGQITTLISGAGIGAVLSAILVFVNNSKKNKLEFITKERSEWRRDIKSIIVDLLNGNNRHSAIYRLETQLNTYGRYISKEDEYEFYMNDGHIWKLIDNFDYSSKNVRILTKYLELLLKFDWERSKREIKFDAINNLIYFVLVVGSLSNFLFLLNIKEILDTVLLTLSSLFMILGIFFFGDVSRKINEETKSKRLFLAILFGSISYSIYRMLYWTISSEIKVWIAIVFTLLTTVLVMSIEYIYYNKVNIEEKRYIDILKENINTED